MSVHIHVFRLRERYDETYTLARLEWKQDKRCRCGKTKKTVQFTWDPSSHVVEY